MAWLEQTQSGVYHVAFRFDGQKFKKSLRTRDARAANARLHGIDETIRLIENGRLTVPDDVDLGTFLFSDGRRGQDKTQAPKRRLRTLRQFADAFMASLPAGALEKSCKGQSKNLAPGGRKTWRPGYVVC